MDTPDYTNEEWRAIEEAPDYAVSNFGRVKNIEGRFLTCGANGRGYPNVRLRINGIGKTFYVHRLVAFAFLGKPPTPNHKHVAHGDGTRDNNAVSNLRWATASENYQDRLEHDTHHLGERNHRAKLTDEQSLEIKHSTERGDVLARRYGVSDGTISRIRGRRRAPNKRKKLSHASQPPAISAL